MKKELKKRILTSILLLTITILCILLNNVVFLIAISAVAYISFNEWCFINSNYFFKKSQKYLIIKSFGFAYLFFCFIFGSFWLRGNDLESIIFFIIVLLICISSDIGGYIFGKTFGGKKLTKISPNKTISGSFGSFLLSLIPLLLLNSQNNTYVDLPFSYVNIFFCLFISLVCQLGDLFISYFKRLNKIKDTGNILPGHGGMLDRIDGIIFVIPVIALLKFLQIF